MKPYHEQDGVTLYLGDCMELLPAIDCSEVSCVIADPPYDETSCAWDRWPDGWPLAVAKVVPFHASLWCFGSLRMFLEYGQQFTRARGIGWRFAQDVIWEKQNGSGFASDRFKRVHEHATHWYRGMWADVFKSPVTEPTATRRVTRRKAQPPHTGAIGAWTQETTDGGPQLVRSVIFAQNAHGYAENETQKPEAIVAPLIRYSAKPGSVVLSPFAGSGTDLVVARALGFRAIGVEMREEQCEVAARRISQTVLNLGGAA